MFNKYLPEKKLYLFDTFEGFVETDIKEEKIQSHVDAEYLQEPTTEENMGLPVGKKLHIAAIHIDDIQEINKNFYDIMLKQRDLVEQMAVRTKEEKELTEELRQKVKEEEDKKDD